jgi:arylformamidase
MISHQSETKQYLLFFCISFLLISCQFSEAGKIAEWRAKHRAGKQKIRTKSTLPKNVTYIPDISYGNNREKKMDIYVPLNIKKAPVIFMVHGGAWRTGNKSSRAVVQNKINRWCPRGFVFISTNYRLLPKTDPLEQANDIAQALAFAQKNAHS